MRVQEPDGAHQRQRPRLRRFRGAVGTPLTAARRARARVVTIVIGRTCGARQLAPLLLDFAFNDEGRVDRSRSDYNGNGVPDGKE